MKKGTVLDGPDIIPLIFDIAKIFKIDTFLDDLIHLQWGEYNVIQLPPKFEFYERSHYQEKEFKLVIDHRITVMPEIDPATNQFKTSILNKSVEDCICK